MKGKVDILLVEDNPDEADLALRALASLECVVARVGNGLEALEFLRGTGRYQDRRGEALPSLVLLDLKLPALDGLEVLKRLRADSATRLVPIVVLTSSNQPSDVSRAYDSGVNSYLVKPVNFDEFVELMKRTGHYWLAANVAPPAAAREGGRHDLAALDC
jgi:two-component system response regulator